MSYIEENYSQKYFQVIFNILHALIYKILFYAMQYEQPLHQVGIEPVASDFIWKIFEEILQKSQDYSR